MVYYFRDKGQKYYIDSIQTMEAALIGCNLRVKGRFYCVIAVGYRCATSQAGSGHPSGM